MRLSLLITTALLAASPALAQVKPMPHATASADDPYLWLEDKDGARPLAWVEAENKPTLARLQGDPRYRTFYQEALAIAAATDRIPSPDQLYGRVYNFWRDAEHPHGLWRWTSEADYAKAQPNWTVALDLDALGKAEGKQWVWKGVTCLQPEERLCLVALSEGGEDAVTYREFDLQAGQFVPNGFTLPRSKQDATWIDADTLLVSRDWGAGTLTQSGYPFVLKTLKRGAPLSAATELFRGAPSDQVSTGAGVLTDGQGHRAVIITRGVTFFGKETLLLTAKGPVKLDLPARTTPVGLIDGLMIFQTSDPWGQVPAGAIASAPLAEVERGVLKPTVIFAPGPRQSLADVGLTRDKLLLVVSDEVRGRPFIYTHGSGGWTSRPLAMADNASINVVSSDDRGDLAYLAVTGFLQPTTLFALDAGTAALKPVKQLPAKFDATGLVTEQFQATSTDGTKVPYFVVHRRDVPLDGSTPTIMTAYGGFELPITPTYSGSTGKLWLERGGAFVLANIRGGGEFGPAWHDAGRKTKRQVIYDDFASVARDLFGRKLTSPAKLGIYGGSNGGLLMGVEFNQHPDLWRAVTIQVPLLDMIRYEHIAAGASWVDEYGSADIPAERAFLQTISPYQNLKRGVAYPEPYIWTTTKDDRVGPQHARKFAARMKEYGLPYLFYEDTAGGHSGDADIEQGARLQAMQMVYFAQKLIGPAAGGPATGQ
ncbi:prolyl oligopeptidase family serine peptidase [Sphingomonas bacterium]|uniref:prolyl oligopeptidase family serine peptidase n=1 Tax=Sphingomonas bacterium TaxID=1895847 RepID=UPI0015759019|nr:prolyl oligopeptidase family serine peptidase [Sphingomonas bacterium]